MNRTKTYALFAIIILITLCVLIYLGFGNSMFFLEMQIEYIKSELRTSLANNQQEFARIVASIRTESITGDFYYLPDADQSKKLHQQIAEFSEEIDIHFSCIYTGGQTKNIYPDNSVVFRRTVNRRNDVYCWIDLVYSEAWEVDLESGENKTIIDEGLIIPLVSNWCIVVLYGF